MKTIQRLLAASALFLAVALPASAEDVPVVNGQTTGQTTGQGNANTAAAAGNTGAYQMQMSDIAVSSLLGQEVYATRTMPSGAIMKGAEKDWDNIGEVKEVIVDRNGMVKAIIVGVGGFLGIGERNVAMTMKDLAFVSYGDNQPDYLLVTNADKDRLSQMSAWEPGMDAMPEPMNQSAVGDANKPTKTTDTAMSTADRPRLERPDINREGYAAVDPGSIKSTDLEGAIVYGPKDENVGEISALLLDESGQIQTVVLDVGGFLGMGERQIGVTMDELNIVRNADGSDLRVYVNASADALKAQPEFKDTTTTGSTAQ